ncbi:hypothetical protein C8R47DRAFT_165194 [Mycena vitilis]|nr:hypothetical protein C8R47DRAFT_165194 [Mycena vitilis]
MRQRWGLSSIEVLTSLQTVLLDMEEMSVSSSRIGDQQHVELGASPAGRAPGSAVKHFPKLRCEQLRHRWTVTVVRWIFLIGSTEPL